MSRRDTIIIAVLVNAGLLMVLFATALKSDHKKSKPLLKEPLALVEETPSLEESVVDQYTMTVPPVPTLSSAPVEEITFEQLPLQELKPVETPALAEPKVAPAATTVVVKKGDFLEKIARANHTTVSALMKENHLSSTELKIGQVLRLPAKTDAVPSTSSATTTASEYYIVKEGDSPWLIASKNHVRLEDLLRLNGLDEQKARRLRPGDKLRIR